MMTITDERQLERKLTLWMKRHLLQAKQEGLDELINMYGIGQVNITRLAEEAVCDSGLIDAALNDETHIVWDVAIDVGEWFEAREDLDQFEQQNPTKKSVRDLIGPCITNLPRIHQQTRVGSG